MPNAKNVAYDTIAKGAGYPSTGGGKEQGEESMIFILFVKED